MITIWKFPLRCETLQTVRMPKGAEVLHVALQKGFVTLWVKVDDGAYHEGRDFLVAGTGRALPDPMPAYVGTVLDGSFVWHVFEIAP